MDPMRLILLAAAGYLVYKYYLGSTTSLTNPPPFVGTQPVGTNTNPISTTPPVSTVGSTATNPPVTTITKPIGTVTQSSGDTSGWIAAWNNVLGSMTPDQVARYQDGQSYVLAAAANGNQQAMAVADSHGAMWDIDHWDFWRSLAGTTPVDPSMMPALIGANDRSQLMTSTDYRARLASVGLSGIWGNSQYSGMGYVGGWY